MTPDQMHREEQHAALMAVQHALTADETARFMDGAIRRFPAFEAEGVTPADVLDYTANYDAFLGLTEPFYEQHEAELPAVPARIFALHALVILGERLTVSRVLKLLFRAGVLDEEHEAKIRNLLAEEVAVEMMRAWGLEYGTEPNMPELDPDRALLLARHAMSRLAAIRERDHIDPLS